VKDWTVASSRVRSIFLGNSRYARLEMTACKSTENRTQKTEDLYKKNGFKTLFLMEVSLQKNYIDPFKVALNKTIHHSPHPPIQN
jgi:hypothetical protein